MIDLVEADVDAFLAASPAPALLDFWSPGCGTCLLMLPALERLASDHSGWLRVARIDASASPALADRLGVGSVPTILIIEDGIVTRRATGLLGRRKLDDLIAGIARAFPAGASSAANE